ARLAKERRERVAMLRAAKYEKVLERHPEITYRVGEAQFLDAHTVQLRGPDGIQHLRAHRFLIATGAAPAVPDIPGLSETPYWTSTEALAAEAVPDDLVVLGSSAVALELAQAWARLGSRVTLLARHGLLSRADPVLGRELAALLRAEGLDIRTDVVPSAVHWRQDQFTLELPHGTLTASRLLVATGRNPNTATLGLKAAGVATDVRGFVEVDAGLATSSKHIYAAGDCTTLPQFVYVAAAAGTRAAMNMMGLATKLDLAVVPAVVFTDPQVATVGLTEAAARAQGVDAEQRTLELDQVPRALVNCDTRGFIKLVAERGSGRLLGAQILAPEAGEMIQAAALALRGGMHVADLADSLFPYLTMAEGLKLCAQTFTRDVQQLSCCAG
ncbi:MAG TPA: FAD-dependent oxidoreductase, partial [Acidiferrobacteraceae bacterium]|nr:FAD-dependent oxidoreductase [Acidiferrobacteraceae bacterium]